MSDPFRLNGPNLPQQEGLVGELQSEVAVEATPLLSFVVRHIRLLVGVVVLLIIAIAAVGGWRWYEASNLHDAEIKLGHVRLAKTGADRIAALEKLAKELPASLLPGIELDIAATALSMQNFPKAAEAYAKLSALAPKSPIGLMAALNQADILQRSKKYTEALAVLDALEKQAPESMKLLILEGQASNAELAGDTARALTAYEALAKAAGAQDAPSFQNKINSLKAKSKA